MYVAIIVKVVLVSEAGVHLNLDNPVEVSKSYEASSAPDVIRPNSVPKKSAPVSIANILVTSTSDPDFAVIIYSTLLN